MKSVKELNQFFDNQLHPWLLPLEEYRKKKIRVIRIIIGILIGFLVFLLVFLFISPLISVIIFPATLIVGGLLKSSIDNLNQQLRPKFKVKILPQILTFLFEDYTYLPTQRIAASVLKESRLIPGVTSVEGEDYMCFRLGETSIHFSEIIAFGYSQKIIFQGIFLSSTFNKHFTSKTIILPRNWSTITRSNINSLFSELKPVNLENQDFNNTFLVMSTDQVEARYILSTRMMERLLDYQGKTGKRISFSFTGNLMHCAIPNMINLFEPPVFETILDTDFFMKSFEALKNYTDIVEDLNLNVRIWK